MIVHNYYGCLESSTRGGFGFNMRVVFAVDFACVCLCLGVFCGYWLGSFSCCLGFIVLCAGN